MKKILLFSLYSICILFKVHSQLPNPVLVGYWHNWSIPEAPYIQLNQIDSRYNVIEVSFAVPTSPSDMTMTFTPDGITQQQMITQINQLKAAGKKIIISIGGATTSIDLSTTVNKSAFITSMTNIINTYGFDGIDIDIEHGNSIMITSGGSISNVSNNPAMQNLIDAIKQIMSNYRQNHPNKLILTMAPETAYVQGGQSGFGSIWGGYLPIIHALRDSLDILQVQLYNSGTMYGIDNNIYTQGTADFIIAMTEAVIQGFNTNGGFFTGIAASKVAVGLPACPLAAGGGFTDTNSVMAAIKYLRGNGPKPGNYTLVQSGGYPNLRGMMTWSINWDAVSNCGTVYQFARNFQNIFLNSTNINFYGNETNDFQVFPNPAENIIIIKTKSISNNFLYIYNSSGILVSEKQLLKDENEIDLSDLPTGLYLLRFNNSFQKIIKQ